MAINKVNTITDETLDKIKKKSVLYLPNRPGEKGITAQQMKQLFTDLVVGSNLSTISEIKRIVTEINNIINQIELADIEVKEELQLELSSAVDELNLAISGLESDLLSHKNNTTNAHGINTLIASLNSLSDNLQAHANNTDAHALNLVKADILELENALDDKLANSHNTDEEAHSDIRVSVAEAKAIAEGKAKAKVFQTKADALNWLASHSNELNVGDNIYIEALNEPDYWWNGSELKELETEKPDLTDYYKKELVYTKSEADNKFVQEEEGKGLSSNDFTTAEKDKLAGIQSGAKVDLFWCTKGTTTYEEITQALNAGKLPVLMYMGNLFIFNSGAIGTESYRFASSANVDTSVLKALYITPSNTWSALTGVDLQLKRYMVQEIGETHTEYDYPSVNAVKTLVNNAILGLLGGEY